MSVTDKDRNLDPAKQEKIDVMLISKSGDRKGLTLTETGPNTGIFIGNIPTRLATGKHQERILEVLAGETLSVEYLEPIRANGERNVILRGRLPVQGR